MIEKKVYFIPGDGIGPEIWSATRPVLDKAIALEKSSPIVWEELLAGEKAQMETGNPLPPETLEKLAKARFAIKGPLATPVGGGIRSLNVALRQNLDLYACIRPIQYMPGLKTPVKHPEKVKMVIFRENTEDVYAGIEFGAETKDAKELASFLKEKLNVKNLPANSAIGVKPMSEVASKRLIRKAINYALANKLPNVTLVHKGNIMKFTEGAFRKWGYEVAEAEFADQVTTEAANESGKLVLKDRIADAMFQETLLHPEQYSVLATPNLNGDYLSDALAAQVGGLGLAPGVNKSDTLSFYEATHGTAPGIAGKNLANPGSLLLCGAMLLEEMHEENAGARVRGALEKAIANKSVPQDLALQIQDGKTVSCSEFGAIVADFL